MSFGSHTVEVEILQDSVKLDGQDVAARLETVGVGPLRYLTMEGSTTPMAVEQGGGGGVTNGRCRLRDGLGPSKCSTSG